MDQVVLLGSMTRGMRVSLHFPRGEGVPRDLQAPLTPEVGVTRAGPPRVTSRLNARAASNQRFSGIRFRWSVAARRPGERMYTDKTPLTLEINNG